MRRTVYCGTLQLLSKTNSDDKVVDGLFLSDAIYAILLVLAELKPLNNDDIISGEPINKKNSIFIASGQQFDITQLIKYHHSRLPRKNETEHEKQLLNPLTNEAFSLQDREHIQAIAKERSIPIRDLKVDEIWRNNNLDTKLKNRLKNIQPGDISDILKSNDIKKLIDPYKFDTYLALLKSLPRGEKRDAFFSVTKDALLELMVEGWELSAIKPSLTPIQCSELTLLVEAHLESIKVPVCSTGLVITPCRVLFYIIMSIISI